jgi:hypothetical protein
VGVWGEPRPIDFIKSLGITYRDYEYQPMTDNIKFIDCKKLPKELPSFIRMNKV